MIMIGIFAVIAVGMTILAARRGYRERLKDYRVIRFFKNGSPIKDGTSGLIYGSSTGSKKSGSTVKGGFRWIFGRCLLPASVPY